MTSSHRPQPVLLMILDGWGIASHDHGNAVKIAPTPTIDSLTATYPHTTLAASGESVGLPHGEDGNTETGHLNLGAGKIVYQDLPRISQAIANGTFFTNREFLSAINHARSHHSTLHLIGLIGSGGVHSHLDHLYALLNLCQQQQLTQVAIHAITDGRDSPPTSGINYLQQLDLHLKQLGVGHLATIIGRYFAMDRDRRWDRTEIAYKALTAGTGTTFPSAQDGVLASYRQNITDEFIKPIIIPAADGRPILIKDKDAVIFFNYRIDRPRQLTKAFVFPNLAYVNFKQEGFDPYSIKYYQSHLQKPQAQTSTVFDRGPLLKDLFFVTMTEYEKGLPAHIAFPPELVDMPLGRVVSDAGLRQLRMSETEKERFVTFYFNGQREDPFMGEDRIIIPSPPVPTYDQKPEMSAYELTQTLIDRINTQLYDLIIINYASPDMVAHTGNLAATIKACQVVDDCVKQVTDLVTAVGGVTLITADHGNAEELINLESGQADTEHSSFPVPLIIVGNSFQGKFSPIPPGILADVAPTILDIMGLPIPSSMSGRSLISHLNS